METRPDNLQTDIAGIAAELCAASLGTECRILDHAFRPIEAPFITSERCAGSICERVKAAPDGATQCAVAQEKGARRAVQLGGPYFYACHAELVEAIVPVQLEGDVSAYVRIGPLFLAPADALLTNQIVEKLSFFHISEETVRQEMELIPVVGAERFKRALNLLGKLVSTPLVGFDVVPAEDGKTEVGEETPTLLGSRGRSARHGKGATASSAKQRFILAKTRLGNLVEMRQDIGELVWRKAEWCSSAHTVRAAALETVSALWRTALEKDGNSVPIDPRNLALSELFDARTYDAVLDWATGVVRRLGRKSAAVSAETRTKLKKIQSYTRRRLPQRLSAATVAKAAGMSTCELDRMLRSNLGMGFRLYLTMERLSFARRLLRESNLTATQIAAKAGFSDQSNFTKTFLRLEGITPIQYRMNGAPKATSAEPQPSG